MRGREHGAVLLCVVLMAAGGAALTASLATRAASAATEYAARRDALCARHAALGGLALGQTLGDPVAGAALVGGSVRSLAVARVRRGPSWCVLRATASCGRASRTFERTLDDPAACDD